jgi:hypothetical protein
MYLKIQLPYDHDYDGPFPMYIFVPVINLLSHKQLEKVIFDTKINFFPTFFNRLGKTKGEELLQNWSDQTVVAIW